MGMASAAALDRSTATVSAGNESAANQVVTNGCKSVSLLLNPLIHRSNDLSFGTLFPFPPFL